MFFPAAEKMVRRSGMHNVTIYKVNNLSYVGKRNVEAEELEAKHLERLEKLNKSSEWNVLHKYIVVYY